MPILLLLRIGYMNLLKRKNSSLQDLQVPFCWTCSLQGDPVLKKRNKKNTCDEKLYPQYTFYSYDRFMQKFFPSEQKPSARCDAVFIGKKCNLFIEQKARNWFINSLLNSDSTNKKAASLRDKCLESIRKWEQKIPSIHQKKKYIIVFSKKLAYSSKPFPTRTNSTIKNFIRQKLLIAGAFPIPVEIFCCDDLEKVFATH